MFFGDWLQRREMLSPNKVALIDAINDNQPITYREWNQQTNQLANFFQNGLGIRKGDRVSIYAMNRVEYLDALFACNKLGAILHVINWRLKVRELEPMINDVAPRVLLYSQEFSSQVDALRPRLATVEQFIGLDQVTNDQDPHWPTERSNWPKTQLLPVELDWEDPWVICYTGGTTGLPKGAILHYRSITANSVNTILSWGLRPDDVIPQYVPFFHTGGLNCLTTPLVHLGGTNIICAGFDIDQLFDQIQELKVTFFFAVPTMFLTMIQHPRWESLDLSNVRLVMAGGGPCPTVVYEAFCEKGVEFKSGYGLTEAGPNTFWLPTEEVKSKMGSVGRPLFHIDVKLVDEAGEEIGPNDVGHLLIRGLHLFGGYWNRPEATAEAVVDGWLHTGDLARRDEDGCYYIVGRLKDMIKSGGENIYPTEVEDLMHSHPAIVEAVLIPVPDPKWGEVGRAIIVLKPGARLTQADLIDWLREQMAHYKVPKSVVFVDALPKTAANKVDKRQLIEQYGS
ncbi:MAG: long-chain fatty acid--CoA ligase [Anaerolineae bacterium]